MKKIIIVILFFCCLPQVHSQVKYYIDDPINILKIVPLERFASSFDINSKSYIRAAGVIRAYSYWFRLGNIKDVPLSLLDTGKPELYIEEQYDTNGNAVKKIVKAIDEDRVTNFFYDKEGLLTKYISYKDSSFDYECNLTYDSAGNLIHAVFSSEFYFKRKKTYFSYDSENNLIEENNYNGDSTTNRNNRIYYKYDKFGNCIEKKTVYPNRIDTDFVKYIIEYDDEGKILYKTGYDESDKILNEEKYIYESGRISEISYDWGAAWLKAIYNNSGLLVSIKDYQKRKYGVERIFNTNYYNKHNLIIKILIRDSFKGKETYDVNINCYEYR